LSQKADNDQNNPLYRSTDGIQSDGSVSTNSDNYLNNDEDRDRYYKNCGKLSGARTPYFDGGLFVPGYVGDYAYMSSRGNSFSNRHQTGIIRVQSAILSNGNIVLVVVGAAVAMGLAGAGIVFLRRRRRQTKFIGDGATAGTAAGGPFASLMGSKSKKAGTTEPTASGAPPAPTAPARQRPGLVAAPPAAAPVAAASGSGSMTVTALYNHVPSEAGELAFKKGDIITVLRRDDAGWWEGRGPDGAKGIFPVNYTTPAS
jgi:LPXTG-motif cell wall-anchored protein